MKYQIISRAFYGCMCWPIVYTTRLKYQYLLMITFNVNNTILILIINNICRGIE